MDYRRIHISKIFLNALCFNYLLCLCPLNNKLDQELHLSSFLKKKRKKKEKRRRKDQEMHIEKLILSIFDLKKKESDSILVALTNSIILYGL